ncbi:MAG: HD domain-containing protein [Acutalibacter sp.]|nr:HD domain-containing protein [Acutalibacter sp.]
MNFERLEASAFRAMGKRKSHVEREIGHVYFHGKRVSHSVLLLRKRIFPEDDSRDEILRCAGLFHDIGKGIEPHARTGAALARELLKDELSEAELNAVCEIISVHDDRHPEDDRYSPWVKLLQDADHLDHFGSQGLWLSFTYRAYVGQEDMMGLPAFYESEWDSSVPGTRSHLNFDISKEIFDEKVKYERDVIRRLKLEGEGDYV